MGFVSKVGKNKNNHRERKDLHRGPQRKNSVELCVFLCALCGKKIIYPHRTQFRKPSESALCGK